MLRTLAYSLAELLLIFLKSHIDMEEVPEIEDLFSFLESSEMGENEKHNGWQLPFSKFGFDPC